MVRQAPDSSFLGPPPLQDHRDCRSGPFSEGPLYPWPRSFPGLPQDTLNGTDQEPGGLDFRLVLSDMLSTPLRLPVGESGASCIAGKLHQ
ncbi:hypothetical protein E2C01_057864 [Portunus trituberculatus]|uniref:Uncharacterized protein n=1 Tax=Portunus trituberculatus TaxID=210409 RepID=A0A5B7GU42_PORTR|nr:hypothetical protein [Portunus trituberculatus]